MLIAVVDFGQKLGQSSNKLPRVGLENLKLSPDEQPRQNKISFGLLQVLATVKGATMNKQALATMSIFLIGTSALAQEKTAETPPLRPALETHFIGGGMAKIKDQVTFPVVHPVRFANNCTYPARHPLECFKRFSAWVEPYNSGLSACSSLSSIGSSVGIYGILARMHGGGNNGF